MEIFNTLTKKTERVKPVNDAQVGIYSCGPTVYDHVHIGNLSSFIYADTLRRALSVLGYVTKHVMNFTDIDDKTIKRSREVYKDYNPMDALKKLTMDEQNNFLNDAESVGINIDDIKFIKATESISEMQNLIKDLVKNNTAYIADDGIYFSIGDYVRRGRKYGQLSNITTSSTNTARINNDEYDKDSAHDFVLWKFRKDHEPAWDFEFDGTNYEGRPGWHIECSAMSVKALGQPFDIHTGGTDLIFPHHENEIAQSTSGDLSELAKIFMHNEHLLVDSQKMSKSLNNFYTLEDIKSKSFSPLAFRLLVLQSHYRSILHFTWKNLQAAENRLKSYQAMADLRWQIKDSKSGIESRTISDTTEQIKVALKDDMNIPKVLSILSDFENRVSNELICSAAENEYNEFIELLDEIFGLELSQGDIDSELKDLIKHRDERRQNNDYEAADKIRKELENHNIGVRDTVIGSIWYRL